MFPDLPETTTPPVPKYVCGCVHVRDNIILYTNTTYNVTGSAVGVVSECMGVVGVVCECLGSVCEYVGSVRAVWSAWVLCVMWVSGWVM